MTIANFLIKNQAHSDLAEISIKMHQSFPKFQINQCNIVHANEIHTDIADESKINFDNFIRKNIYRILLDMLGKSASVK